MVHKLTINFKTKKQISKDEKNKKAVYFDKTGNMLEVADL